ARPARLRARNLRLRQRAHSPVVFAVPRASTAAWRLPLKCEPVRGRPRGAGALRNQCPPHQPRGGRNPGAAQPRPARRNHAAVGGKPHSERCPSGRRSTPGKCVWLKRSSWVRIPSSLLLA
nr:hypothetical protein [Tanacetum cinerariifolium]